MTSLSSQVEPQRRYQLPISILILGRVLRFALPYWKGLTVTAVAILAAAGFAIATPVLLRWAIDIAISTNIVNGETVIEITGWLVLVAGLALVGAAVLRGTSMFVQRYLAEWVGQTVAYDLRNAIYQRLQTLSFRYHDGAETGQIMVRATQDVEVVRMFINFGGVQLTFTLVLGVGTLVIMLLINWPLALMVWGIMILIAARSAFVARRLRPIWNDVQESQAQLGTVLQEALSGIRVVKAFGRSEFEGQKFGRAAGWLQQRSYDASMVQAVNMPLMTMLGAAAIVLTIWYGGREVVNGNFTVGELTMFLMFLTVLQMPIRGLGWMVMMVPRAATAGMRIFEILDQESEVQDNPSAVAPEHPQGHIKFDQVGFAYDPRSPVLGNIDFEAKPGELIALLGLTGSGKTTVVNLIPRFYDVSTGRVTFDDQDVREWPLEALRQQVAIVQQEVFLFAATLKENIAYGRPDATDEEIEAAAKLARIHHFINRLPEQYDTWVGERGANFSGGQKQRIAIARALLMDPRVLIFDDSTSSVDAATEFEIQQAMAALMRGRTTFVIAHRLRSLREADQILVLDKGRIVQRGKHDELLEEGGLYREIYELELRDQESAQAQAEESGELAEPTEAAAAAGGSG
ncbi:MAG: ABC transporter ATP-binding protein [Chloroflexi bacterium]|nr:ABC transporter ATP-binding protein [Chloroflexota bacterium]MCY3687261.1 ABC transporter ATP-binding protein [Chloroflexota bacterium]MDE2709832.1 ABC transporter ATP-binding protein [Chloroflexota bacterium]